MTSPDRALQTDARIAALRVIATGRPQILDGIAVIEDELTGLRAYAVDTRRRLDDTRDAQVHALQRLDECQARATQLKAANEEQVDCIDRQADLIVDLRIRIAQLEMLQISSLPLTFTQRLEPSALAPTETSRLAPSFKVSWMVATGFSRPTSAGDLPLSAKPSALSVL